MSKSKLSKRQIAGALLLSSTVIGATASGTVSAGFMDFMKNTHRICFSSYMGCGKRVLLLR